MTYMGRVQGGSVIFAGDEKPEDGTLVRIETIEQARDPNSIGQKLLKLAGTLEGPEDGSVNVDHYLYGLPKK